MKLVIDMNLSTDWVQFLNGLGHDAVHWWSIGQQDADDEDILLWAREGDRIVLTSDLDFGTRLIVSGAPKPSVIQLRTEHTLPAHVGSLVARAIARSEPELKGGALVTIEPHRLRSRPLAIEPEE